MTSKILPRYKSSNGLTYSKSGSGEPIVLVHGVGLRAEAWLEQISELNKTNTVYAVDMPGHGESELLINKNAGLEDYVDVIAAWIKTEIAAPVIMLGHSMGSMIALSFASRYSELCMGVAALNSVYRRSEAAKQSVQQRAKSMINNPNLDRVNAPMKRWFKPDSSAFEESMAKRCKDWLESAPAEGYARAYVIFSENDGADDKTLANITVPVTFITGDEDNNSSPLMSQQMAAICPNASNVVIPNSGHMLQITHPKALNNLLVPFVERCKIINKETKMKAIDSRELRNAFGSFMTGVTVVTAISNTGEKVGFTANSFTSVSVEPPLLLVCPSNKLSSFDIFNRCEHFVVNILAADQQDISNTFAGGKGDRFADITWHSDVNGCPVIDGSVAHFSCSTHSNIPAGDHILLVGQVNDFTSNDKLGLGYAKGGYFNLGMEHRAEELTHSLNGVVGGIIEFEQKVLLCSTEKGYSLPQIAISAEQGSQESLRQYLDGQGITSEFTAVYSIYENLSDKTFTSFYRLNASNDNTAELGEYIDINHIADLTFISDDIQSMMERFLFEKKNDSFGLYVGDQKSGDIR
jgi:flavin reductase (DIM6/NTAB) family NADH-FMN oxidoreductase RutF/pimeloyl-ACP methyl ester carboxylesterase